MAHNPAIRTSAGSSVHCPWCESINLYYRTRTDSYLCRRCGTISKLCDDGTMEMVQVRHRNKTRYHTEVSQ